jgi:uncharacterized protein
MDKMKELVNEHKLFEIVTGSHLYGTNTETSDKDCCGVFIEPFEYLISPFKNIEEVDLSIKDVLESGKNSKDAVDIKYYALKKFIKLLSQNNPNIVEFLFIPDDKIIYVNDMFKEILQNSEVFLHIGLIDKFMGYAFEQEKKMYVRSENFSIIHAVWKSLKQEYPNLSEDTPIRKTKTAEKYLEPTTFLHKHSENNPEYMYKCGDLQFGTGLHIKKVMELLSIRIEKASYRKDMTLDKGYDYKFASHIVRLLSEGYQLMTEHKITFPLQNAEEITDIKNGKYTLEYIKESIDDWKSRFRIAEESCDLPSRNSNQKKIERLTSELQMRWYKL